MSSFQVQMSFVVLALIIWSEIILVWLYRLRIPAFKKLKNEDQASSQKTFPPNAVRVADNYNHLMEQPTLFYPLCLLIIFLNLESGLSLFMAWSYVVFRFIHSLYQININYIPYRFMLFALSSISMIILSANTFRQLLEKL